MEPQITPSYYTTSDAVISTETVFIVEISLTCKNRVQVRQQGFSQEGEGRGWQGAWGSTRTEQASGFCCQAEGEIGAQAGQILTGD